MLAAAEELGYLPDVTARGFRQGRGTSIGLLVSDLRSPLQAEIAAGVGERLDPEAFTLMVAHTTNDPDRQLEAARAFAARRVEGMVLTPLGDATSDCLQELGIPVVEVDGLPSGVATDRVLPDAEEAGRRLMRHLQDLGHRRITLVLDDSPTTSQREFASGCGIPDAGTARSGVAEGDRPVVVRTSEIGSRTQQAVPLAEATAVLAASPAIAERLWTDTLDSSQGRLRRSLAVLGDAPWMPLVSPAVTVARVDAVRLGMRAAERLMTRLRHPEADPVVERLPAEILVRDSTRPPRDTF